MKIIFSPFVYLFALGLLMMSCAAKKELASLRVEHLELENELATQRLENQNLLESTSDQKDQITDLKDNSYRLEQKLRSARSTLQQVSQQDAACPEAMKAGVVFKVQIGAFEKIDLPENLDTSVNLSKEQKGDLNKYVVGQFREYQKADRLKEELRNMGVKEAWIVPYRDGKRVPLEDVLDAVNN